jgi:hypothetical protein
MVSMAGGLGGQTSAPAPRANCAHLHSAFGPGCPYCGPAAVGAARDGGADSGLHERFPGRAGDDTAYLLGDQLEPRTINHPDHDLDLDLGIVA